MQSPYGHGWEVRDQSLAIFGQGAGAMFGAS